MTEAEDFQGLHPTLVANCAVNAFLSFTAIRLNVITIQALRKTVSLSKTLKTLLLSLAVSDLGVGLLAQPLYIATLVIKIDPSTLFGCSVLLRGSRRRRVRSVDLILGIGLKK